MCSTDFEPSAVWSESRITKARKAWTCYECGLPIPVGAAYIKTVAIQERGDRPDTYCVHPGCDALRDFIMRDICLSEAKRDAASRGTFVHDPGAILMGGLAEEIGELNEYNIATPGERDDLVAMGFKCELDDDGDIDEADGPREICEWLWDCIKAEYRPQAVAA